MRTTLTLDADLASALRERAAQRGVALRQVVNEAIRAGLEPTSRTEPVRVPSLDLLPRTGVRLEGAHGLVDDREDAEHGRRLAPGQ